MKSSSFISLTIMLFVAVSSIAQSTKRINKSFSDSCFQPGDIIMAPEIAFTLSGGVNVVPEYFDSVKVIADFLKSNPDIKIEIGVHTDYRGNAEYNLALSVYRANAIKELLIKKFGIASNRMHIKGYGESQPIYSENRIQKSKSDASRMLAINNRVEIRIL